MGKNVDEKNQPACMPCHAPMARHRIGVMMRVTRIIARTGLCSRRQAEEWISQGRVRVGNTVLGHGDAPHAAHADIRLDGAPLPPLPEVCLWRFHKPRGCLVTRRDPRARATIFDFLPQSMGGLLAVGRLDYDSEGLLLLTNDGGVSRFLELPKNALARRYLVEGVGPVDFQRLRRIRHSVTIDGVRYRPLQIKILEHRQDSASGSERHRYIRLLITIEEGKNREIRRLMQYCSVSVTHLRRLAYGPWRLGRLAPGQWASVKGEMVKRYLPAALFAELGGSSSKDTTVARESE